MGSIVNKITLWIQLVFVTVLIGSFLLVWSLTVFKTYHREEGLTDISDMARDYSEELMKVTNETEFQMFFEENTGFGAEEVYFCVMNPDGSVRLPSKTDDVSRQMCEEEILRPSTAKVDKEMGDGGGFTVHPDIHNEYPVPMYQYSAGHNPQGENPRVRIFFKQELFSLNKLWHLATNKTIFFFPLLLFMLLLYIVYWILNPLRRIEKEVAHLITGGCEYMSVDNYPRELASLANVLNRFISDTHKAQQEAEEAEQRAKEAEQEAKEARCKTDANREEILRRAIDLSDEMVHHRVNIIPEDVLDKMVISSPETLEKDFRQLRSRVYSIIEETDKFIKDICAIGQKDKSQQNETANIHEILNDKIKSFKKNNTTKNYKITGLEWIQGIQISIAPQILTRMCIELLSNATKYSDSKVLIQVGRNDNNVWIKIHNDGEKFPAVKRESMFDYGVRANHKRTGGTGRGLFFMKQAADLSGCVIELQNSEVLSGACVYLEVPLS